MASAFRDVPWIRAQGLAAGGFVRIIRANVPVSPTVVAADRDAVAVRGRTGDAGGEHVDLPAAAREPRHATLAPRVQVDQDLRQLNLLPTSRGARSNRIPQSAINTAARYRVCVCVRARADVCGVGSGAHGGLSVEKDPASMALTTAALTSGSAAPRA